MTALRPYQQRAIDLLRRSYASGRRAPMLVAPTGAGKCLGIGTPVLRFDGTISPVEEIAAGDLLMGPDSKPRRVLSTARGNGELYRVTPNKGESWICNDVHVLTLVDTESDDVIDIDVQSYLGRSKWFRHCHKQFSPPDGVDFPVREPLPLDPYFLGVWYGDGTKRLAGVAISKPDPEIKQCIDDEAGKWGLNVRTDISGTCPTHHIAGRRGAGNPLLSMIRGLYADGKFLPHQYLTSSRADRLSFLAGLLDTDGHMTRGGFDVVQKVKGFSEGICFLARSVGLRASMSMKTVNGSEYWRVTISGDCSMIPNRIPRKKAGPRQQQKVATRTGITVSSIGHGEYAGFELDGDGRFLLGDFTVTHNTIIAAEIIRSATSRGTRVLFVAPRRELIKQTVAKLASAGIAEPRVIMAADDTGPRDAAVTVGSIQTLTMARWRDVLPAADLLIIDECHHIAADNWARLAQHYRAARILGLTATPERADGRPMGDIFDDIVVAATVRELTALGHLAPARFLAPSKRLETGELAMSPLAAYQQHGIGQPTVVFCMTVEHAKQTASELTSAGVSALTVTGSMAATKRDAALAAFAERRADVLCSVGVLTEGWDCPIASCAILARRFGHAGLFLQVVGRVLRPAPGKQLAVVVDLCGSVHDHGTPDLEREYSLTGKPIVRKDALSQCRGCGSMFLAGQGTCPYCGEALPIGERDTAPPKDTGVGVAELKPPAPKREFEVRMVSKRYGRCVACGGPVEPGMLIRWATLSKTVRHASGCATPALPDVRRGSAV